MNQNQGPFFNGQENMRMTDEQAQIQAQGMQQWAPSSNASQMMGVNRIGGGRFDIPAGRHLDARVLGDGYGDAEGRSVTPPIFDADELRAKAEAARCKGGSVIDRVVARDVYSAAMSPEVTIALLDELKATRAQLADERNKTSEAEEDAFFKKDWR